METSQMHRISAAEIEQLERQGNRAEDWNNVWLSNQSQILNLWNNVFMGKVKIGQIDGAWITHGSLRLKEGIENSRLENCTIGNHCAICNVSNLSNYSVGNSCLLFNVGEISCSDDYKWLEPMNENGGRRILPFNGMTIGDAYFWARYRGHSRLMERLESFTDDELKQGGGYGVIGDACVIKNCSSIHNVAVRSSADDPSSIEDCITLSDGIIGFGCVLEYGCIAARFLLGEHVHLEFGARLNDVVVGDNSTIARCEVGCSIIFPSHEQHHNNSFLIAALVMGQSNIAAGGTIGSNHNSRTADNEIAAGRGFWPGLCCSLKHSSRFASYCLLSKADYPAELDIKLPFALVNNNVSKDQLEIMPAYWWMYNMYAMNRNSKKFAARDKRVFKKQHIEFDNLAPDTAEEILEGIKLLSEWEKGNETKMEKSKRKTVVLKLQQGRKAYEDMLVFYAMKNLTASGLEVPSIDFTSNERQDKWVNIGGQLISQSDMNQLINDIEAGKINSWEDVHARFDSLWNDYSVTKNRHAYQILCDFLNISQIDNKNWQNLCKRYDEIKEYIDSQIRITRQKDDENPFRNMTYWDEDERNAVLG